MAFIKPKKWSKEEFEEASRCSRDRFSVTRRTEGIDYYLIKFDEQYERVSELMSRTDNLRELEENAQDLFADEYLNEIRYLASPVISEDDLQTLSEVSSIAKTKLSSNVEDSTKVVELIFENLDPERFPWVAEGRDPKPDEFKTALTSTTVMMASQKTQTNRRNIAKELQEGSVADYLKGLGYNEVARRSINTVADAPKHLEFCRESKVSGKKADIVLGLADGRFMAIECKVSNSEVNSVKRLNHETVSKVTLWNSSFGTHGVVGAAVLAGVFKVSNLMSAQDEGVSIFWSYDLAPLGDFLARVAEDAGR